MQPRRFILSGAEMSEGFAAAECFPANTEFFSGLLPASGVLPTALRDVHGDLDPAARQIFKAIAKPEFSLRLLNIASNSLLVAEARVLAGDDGVYVALSRPYAGHWDVALLGEREMALAFVDELLGISDAPPLSRSFATTLTMPQLAILAATAQHVRREELKARLDGREASFGMLAEAISLQQVDELLRNEKRRPDPGSPLSRLAMLCEGRLLDVRAEELLEQGKRDLIANGLADSAGAFSADGLGIVSLLKGREATIFVQTAQKEGAQLVLDTLVLMYGPGSLLAGSWQTDAQGKETGFALSAMSGAELLGLVDAKMGPLILRASDEIPAQKSGFCDGCGTLYGESPKYCRECGLPL